MMFLKQDTFNYEKQSVVLSELSGLQRIEYLTFVQQRTAKFDAGEGELPEAEQQIAFLRMGMDINAWLVSRSLWNAEIDLTEVGGERYFFCNEQNDKGEPVTWQGRQYQAYPIQGTGFELNGKGSAARPTLTVSNLHGMVTGMAEDLQSLVGGTVVRRKVYARFLDAVNFVNGNSDADPEQEVISRWRIEQCSELSAVSASFVLSTPTETDGAVFPGRIMLANTCTWTYRGDECGYHGPAVADEYDQPTSDITKDKCSKCLSGCKFRNNVGNFGGFLSINKLSQ
ncbi:TPA: phage minor tail protein L [Escherichia coli]|nr:phage minor tail protein L [Escherichia coli]